MDDLRTPHLDLPLPCNPDSLEADMPRILAAFRALDAKIEALDTLLASDDVTLDSVQELVAAIKAARTDLGMLGAEVASRLQTISDDVAAQLATQNNAILTYLNSKAAQDSPELTGTPTAPTAAAGTNTTQLATTAFVAAAFNGRRARTYFSAQI